MNIIPRIAFSLAFFWLANNLLTAGEPVLGLVAFSIFLIGIPFTIQGILFDVREFQTGRGDRSGEEE